MAPPITPTTNTTMMAEQTFASSINTFLTLFIPMLVQKQASRRQMTDHASYLQEIKQGGGLMEPTFDFIIVGGGTAGLVLANRLSAPENNFSVLVLEAGGDPSLASQYPGLGVNVHNLNYTDWMYMGHPKLEKHNCLSCADQTCALHTGKSLGGSSNNNGMQYHRGVCGKKIKFSYNRVDLGKCGFGQSVATMIS